MKIDVYCPICKTTTRIDFEPEQGHEKTENDDFISIPSPDAVGGLRKLSIVHNDHILVLDVDMNGAVRRTDTINRITSNTQRYMATAISDLKNFIKKKRSIRILILSEMDLWKKFLNYLSGQIIIDSTEDNTGISFFSNTSGAELKFKTNIITLQRPSTVSGERNINAIIIDDLFLSNKNTMDYVLSRVKPDAHIVINRTENSNPDEISTFVKTFLEDKGRGFKFLDINSIEDAAITFSQLLTDLNA